MSLPYVHDLFCVYVLSFFKKNLFIIYFWLHWVFFAVCWLSLVVVSGGYSVVVHGLLIVVASPVVEHGL